MKKSEKKLAIFGPYPPPLGGISVHIERISKYLNKGNIPYTIFNYGHYENQKIIATKKSPWFYIKFLFEKSFKLIHFHNNISLEFLYYFVFALFNKTPLIITIHAESLLHYNAVIRNLFLFFIKHTRNAKIISVSENIYELLKKENVDVVFLPAYVPPTSINFKKIECKNRDYFLFSVWRLTKNEAENVYNVPLAFNFLRKNRERFQMLFMIGSKESSDLNYLENLLKEYAVQENVLVVFNENIIDYVGNCSFLLRTNLQDAYGISLQEAMDLGVPAIGSNVCLRPKGTVLFENNNLKDLEEKVNYVIDSDKNDLLKEKEDLTYHLQLIDLYRQYLS